MIRVDVHGPCPAYISKFFMHIAAQRPDRKIDVDVFDEELAEYHATYHYEEVGNYIESDFIEWIEFEKEEFYSLFVLRWS